MSHVLAVGSRRRRRRRATLHPGVRGKKKAPPRRRGFEFDNSDLPAAAVAAAAATTTTAAATTGALLGLGHVNADGTTVELGAVQGRNGLVRRLVILEGDKAKTTRATSVAIADHDRFADLAVANNFFDITLYISLSATFYSAPVSQTVVNTASTHTEAGPAGRQQTQITYQISSLNSMIFFENPCPCPFPFPCPMVSKGRHICRP